MERRSRSPGTGLGVHGAEADPGRYQLYDWQNRWIEAGAATATGTPLVFAGVPEVGLYWLVADGSHRNERVFTYEDGRQVLW